MTDGVRQVSLTEDEVVAIAAIVRREWPTPFVSRRIVDADAAARSAERGALSLVVRRLAVEVDGSLDLAEGLRVLVDGFNPDEFVAVYRGPADEPATPAVPVVYVHMSDSDDVLVEVESGTGVRVLALADRAEVVQQLVAVAHSAFDTSSTAVHLAVVHDGRADVVTASTGKVTDFLVAGSDTQKLGHTLFWDDSRVADLFHCTPARS